MSTITKKELIDRIADATDQRRVLIKQVVQMFLDEVIDELAQGNRLEFRDFGVFETKMRKARRAQNPRKREAVWVPERRTVKFKVGRLMKEKIEKDAEPTRVVGRDEPPAGSPAAPGTQPGSSSSAPPGSPSAPTHHPDAATARPGIR
ncbi:MAG: HU family DNA-binding protein, partial [Planctomycetota bacterium]